MLFFLLLYIQSWKMDYYTANGVGGWEPTICRIIATSMTFGQNKKWSFFCIKLHAGKNVYNKNVLAHFYYKRFFLHAILCKKTTTFYFDRTSWKWLLYDKWSAPSLQRHLLYNNPSSMTVYIKAERKAPFINHNGV